MKQKLDTCMDPLDSAVHLSGVVNVVIGQNASSEVNVHKAITVRTTKCPVAEGLCDKS